MKKIITSLEHDNCIELMKIKKEENELLNFLNKKGVEHFSLSKDEDLIRLENDLLKKLYEIANI